MADEIEAREVFRVEVREGHHVRVVVSGEIDEGLLAGLEDFIAWRRRLAADVPTRDP
jgi:phosphotransferase system HPr-like phosphotransfer protein